MRKPLIIASAILLAACSGEEAHGPVADPRNSGSAADSDRNAATGSSAGDPASNGSDSPAPATRPDHGQWHSKSGERGPWAGFGPPASEAAFSLRCEGSELIFSTTEMPQTGPGDTVMRLSGPGIDKALPARATERGLPNTEAVIDASEPWLGKLESASGELIVQIGDGEPLAVPIGRPLTSLVRDCRR